MIFLALILLGLATQAQVEHICSLRFGASRCEISNYMKKKLSAFSVETWNRIKLFLGRCQYLSGGNSKVGPSNIISM